MTHLQFTAFCVSWAALLLLVYVMYRIELIGKRTDSELRDLREAVAA